MLQDLRYSLRTLRNSPGFTIVALLVLGLGIGANTAIFSVINSVVFRSIRYPGADRLAVIWETDLRDGIKREGPSAPNFLDWQEQNHCFEEMTLLEVGTGTLTGVGEVLKRRKKDPNYWHRLKKIQGSSSDFLGDRCRLGMTLDSRAVILRHPDSGHYLDLDPLLVYEDGAGKAPDIFFYNGMKSDTVVEYAACKHGGQFESDRCERADEIAEEVQHLLHLFSPVEENSRAG